MRRLIFWTLSIVILSFVLAPVASADEPVAKNTVIEVVVNKVEPPSGLPLHYARLRYATPVYRTLEMVWANTPTGWRGGRDTWVSIHESAELGSRVYYRTGYGWMPERALQFAAPSALHGVDLLEHSTDRLAMVYWPKVNVHSKPGVAESAAIAGTLEGYDVVSIFEEKVVNGVLWYRIGDDRWLRSLFVRRLDPARRPARIGPDEKWIEVNLSQQVIIAHEGDTPVYATLVSTGLPPKWPTVQGLFRIWIKYQLARMRGGDTPEDQYDLADVPWTMYFYRGYGIHAAYWHDKFGAVRSHGCVNLSPADARWFFDWATPVIPDDQSSVRSTAENPGTWVWVHK